MTKEIFAGFFKKASMGITFEGRELSDDQTKELLGIISDNSDINIVCVLDQNQEIEERFRLALERNNTLSVSNLIFDTSVLKAISFFLT